MSAARTTTLLRFNCFDLEKSYVYGPENADLTLEGPAMLGGQARTRTFRMDPTTDGNPITWTIKTLGTKLPKMLEKSGYPQIAANTNMAEVQKRPARRRGLRPRAVCGKAQHRQAQPRHRHVRGRQHPDRA